MIDFNNTQIAFISKSDQSLRRALLLFLAMANPAIVRLGNRIAQLAHSLHLPMSWIVKPTLYKQFVGGESIDECEPEVRNLEKHNVKAILDFSVEGGHSSDEIHATLNETLRSIANAGNDMNVPFAVFKPTAFIPVHILEKASSSEQITIEEKAEVERFRERIATLCRHAHSLGVPILIDAEDCHLQPLIDEVAQAMMVQFNRKSAIVFNTYQMYRTDRLDVLKKDIEHAKKNAYWLGAKFVRGAYMERERLRAAQLGYPSPIHNNKAATDHAFDAALSLAVENIERVSIFNGTHNEQSCQHLTALMKQYNIDNNDTRFWFSQLYGMSDHISFNLAALGFNVAKYMPYGPVKSVLPYLLRRAEENTSIAGQTGRELRLIRQEIKRRQAAKKQS